jgi:hypothetical protein
MASRTGSPAPPQPDLSMVLTALTGAIAQLAQSQTTLQQNLAQVAHNQAALNTAMQGLVASTQAMQLALQNPPAQTFAPAAVKMTAHIVEKPEKFDGQRNDLARNFLLRFALWASSTSSAMNVVNAQGSPTAERPNVWIRLALGFMTGEAATWANPYIEQNLRSTVIFANTNGHADWATFCDAFKLRWITVANDQAARQGLTTLKQGSHSVEVFYLRFKALADWSNLSDTDLLKRFKASLDPVVLMRMAEVHSDKKTFGPYTKAAIQLDNERCNAENIIRVSNGKEPRYSGASKSANSHAATHRKEKDSDAMDVDAVFLGIAASILTKEQNQQWRLKMKDRCYACSSKDHRLKDCRFRKDHAKCGHCEGEGHTQAVCLRRYAGMPAGPAPKRTRDPKRRAAVARIEEVSDSESEDDFDLGVSTAKPETDPAATSATLAASTADPKKRKTRKKVQTADTKESNPAPAASTSTKAASSTIWANNQLLLEAKIARLEKLNAELLKDSRELAKVKESLFGPFKMAPGF